MCLPPLAEIQAALDSRSAAGLAPLRLVVLRNVTMDGIVPYLRYLALAEGLAAEVRMGAYDQVLQDSSGDGALFEGADAVLVYLWLPAFSAGLTREFAALTEERVAGEAGRIKDYCAAAVEGIRRRTGAPVLWHGFEVPSNPALGILDGLRVNGQTAVIRGLNAWLAEKLGAQGNACLVDADACAARVGRSRFYDWRYWHIGRAPYSREALGALALEDFKFLRAIRGKTRKCLVLDCDNVLWQGVLGEVGMGGIQIGQSHPGLAYREFQQEVLGLYHRGVILALCSKNDKEDVLRVIRTHPEMILREEHFASMRIDWRDKAANLLEIAGELNIGLDSMVFADDSEFEAGLVRASVPEVAVLHLPASRSADSAQTLAACGWFDSLTLSEEDRKRGSMYRAEVGRKEHRARSLSLEDYLRSLGMVARIGRPDDASAARVAQLAQRTNQFNLTTRRYTEDDIRRFMRSPDHDVLVLRLSDRFGDHGMVGLAILRGRGSQVEIDTLLMSCRALGRGAEQVLLEGCVRVARRRGDSDVVGRYIRTPKNGQAADFFARCGFSPEPGPSGEAVFRLASGRLVVGVPDYFQEIQVAADG